MENSVYTPILSLTFLRYWSMMALLLLLGVGCRNLPPDTASVLSANFRDSPGLMLVGEIAEDNSPSLLLSDPVIMEGLFRKDYPYDQENLIFNIQERGFGVEYDEGDYNRFHKRIYYLTALAEDLHTHQRKFLRIELDQDNNRLFIDPSKFNVLHIHTCSHIDEKVCKFNFEGNGFYHGCRCVEKGCDCGGNQEIIGVFVE